MSSSSERHPSKRPLLRSRSASLRQEGNGIAPPAQPDSLMPIPKCIVMVRELVSRCFGDLQFLLDAFAKIEIQVAPHTERTAEEHVKSTAAAATDTIATTNIAAPESKLDRLHSFTRHVRRTMNRLRAAESGRDPMTRSQVELLDQHIRNSILPVKARLVRQLQIAARSHAKGSEEGGPHGTALPGQGMADGCCKPMHTDGDTDDTSTSRNTSVSSNMGDSMVGEQWGVEAREEDERTQRRSSASSHDIGWDITGDEGRDSSGCTTTDTTMSPMTDVGSSIRHASPISDNEDENKRRTRPKLEHDDILSQLEAEGVFAADDNYNTHLRDATSRPHSLGTSALSFDDNNLAVMPREVTIKCNHSAVAVPQMKTETKCSDGWNAEKVKAEPQPVSTLQGSSAMDTEQSEGPDGSMLAPPSEAHVRPKLESNWTFSSTSEESKPIPSAQGSASWRNQEDMDARSNAITLATPSPVHPRSDQGHDPTSSGGSTRTTGNLPQSGVPGNGMMLVPPRPAKKRRSSMFPATLTQPREVRYQCGSCSKSYAATISGNPWWLLVRQECPECHKMQIPRVDILNPTNNVEGHIALLTECSGENGHGGETSCFDYDGETSEDASDDDYSGEEGDGTIIAGFIGGPRDSDDDGLQGCMAGPELDSEQAAKLLVLMCHARGCPGHHQSPRLAEVCRSVKFLMLHLRDCEGLTRGGLACPQSWCRPCKSLLTHLVRCPSPDTCRICTPLDLPPPLRSLRELNLASI